MNKDVKQLHRVIIRFAGDSGGGMQLIGDRFTQESAVFGNDLVTLPNFPAEISIIVDTHDFTARNLSKAGYTVNPRDGHDLAAFAVHPVDLTGMTVAAVKEFGLSRKDAARAKNMFALGLLSWMTPRDPRSARVAASEGPR